VQLAHACHRWGFETVIPVSWGDELLAGEVISRCASRENRPAIHCSCPRVAERLGQHAAKLEQTIMWLATPAVATALYLRAHAGSEPIHITYAGACPGADDASIDQRVTPTELLLAISARGIDIAAQPTVFEDIIPPDRRRHFSSAAGLPDAQRLWEEAAFRLAQPSDIDLSIGIAQLLLGEERLLVDLAPAVGCVCRAGSSHDTDSLRAPTPVVSLGVVDVNRAPPAMLASRTQDGPSAPEAEVIVPEAPSPSGWSRRQSPAKPVFRRHVAWRRQTPRPGAMLARTSASYVAISERRPVLERREVRIAIATAIAVAILALGVWLGRTYALERSVLTGAAVAPSDSPGLLSPHRSPWSRS
jgi:hypothetical protein